MEIVDRIKLFREYLGIGQTAFEVNIGVARGYFSNVKTLGSDRILRIHTKYPELNIEWLVTGNGEMIKNAEREQKTIEISESAISETKRKGALIYDIDATCGLNGRDIEFTDEKVIGSIDAPEINPDSKIIFATGDSMQPLIASGDRVVIRKIESWDYFNYGQVYLIITNEYRFIKRVRRHPKDADNLILLRSENPDYDDIDLPKREIIHLFIVENILSIKNIL
jgi:phage repressor protein C with HTH and peptisase S24 domain